MPHFNIDSYKKPRYWGFLYVNFHLCPKKIDNH